MHGQGLGSLKLLRAASLTTLEDLRLVLSVEQVLESITTFIFEDGLTAFLLPNFSELLDDRAKLLACSCCTKVVWHSDLSLAGTSTCIGQEGTFDHFLPAAHTAETGSLLELLNSFLVFGTILASGAGLVLLNDQAQLLNSGLFLLNF